MKRRTFLSLTLEPWSLSMGTHLAVFLILLLIMTRNRTADLTMIDLDLSPSAAPKASASVSQAPVEEEWQKPFIRKIAAAPPKAQPTPQIAAPPVSAPPVAEASGAGNGTYRSIAEVSQLPHDLTQIKPVYPEAAKRANIEGWVILKVDIDATGTVKKVDLAQGLGYGCDEAAMAAIWQSKFSPAYAGGEPVPVRVSIPYHFKFVY